MEIHKKKPIAKLIAYGLASCALYAMVFVYETSLTEYFTKGGLYTVLPIATVFLFSWIHGTFAGTMWTVLGIDAATKKSTVADAAKAPARKDTRPRATVSV